MDDMVHRLREIGFELGADYYPIVFDAADEIERLRKQVEMTRSDDLVARLRDVGSCGWDTQQEAADEIERLRAEVARLGAFLHPIGEKARRG